MKLGSSSSFVPFGDKIYEKMKLLGYDCHDFNMADTTTPLYTLHLDEAVDVLKRRKELADSAGIEIWQVHGPWRTPPMDSTTEDRKERMEKMKRSIYMTSALGCKRWVIHPLMPCGRDDLLTGKTDETFKINVEFFKELLETAKKCNVTICYENMPYVDFSLSKPEDILRLVNEINDENFKICIDTGHIGVFGNKLSIGDEIRRCGSKIEALHIHDAKWGIDLHLLPGYGTVNWADFSQALNDINFAGCFSLETAPPPTLPPEIFWEQHIALVNIAHSIINGEFN